SIAVDAYLYVVAIALAKLSLLLFLYRIFSVDKRFRIAAWITGAILVIWTIITVFMSIFACRPVKASWDFFLYLDPNTVCHPQSFEVVNVYGFCNVITDFVLIFMPLPLVWRMQMDRKKKIGVGLVFASGALYVPSPRLQVFLGKRSLMRAIPSICAVAIIRQYKLYHTSQTGDPSWLIIPTKIWIALEVNVAIIVACLPALTPLFKRIPYLTSLIPSSIRSRFSQASAMQRRPWPQKLSGPHGDVERADRKAVRGPLVGVGEQAGKTSWQAPKAWREAEKRRFEDLHSEIDEEGSSGSSSRGRPCRREEEEKVMETRDWGGR
ncbi:MAG: hypothetical protein Q9174_007026, partial [Haloplaca sp. 1 TL-2023]